jgi:coenzyme PQQ biosynthesis protein B
LQPRYGRVPARAPAAAQQSRLWRFPRREKEECCKIIVLGAGAGGGFPQWNCNCANCQRARAGDPLARPATQSSLAVSGDGGASWYLLNASPDLRQQIAQTPQLHPRNGGRDSPISGVILTNADVDHVAGLLTMREAQPFNICWKQCREMQFSKFSILSWSRGGHWSWIG